MGEFGRLKLLSDSGSREVNYFTPLTHRVKALCFYSKQSDKPPGDASRCVARACQFWYDSVPLCTVEVGPVGDSDKTDLNISMSFSASPPSSSEPGRPKLSPGTSAHLGSLEDGTTWELKKTLRAVKASAATATVVAMGETPISPHVGQSAAAGKAGIPAGSAAPSWKGAKVPTRKERAAIPGPSNVVSPKRQSAVSGKAGFPAGAAAPLQKGGKVPSAYLWSSVPVCTKSPPNGVPPPNGKRDVRTRCDCGLHRCVGNCDLCCSKRAQYCVSTPGNESSDTLSLIRSPVPVCTGHTPSGERCNLDPFLPHAGQPAVSGVKAESAQ